MDECTGAPGYEYVELPNGGVMWESPAKPAPSTLAIQWAQT